MIDRCYRASASIALLSTVVLIPLSLLLQFSPFAPFASIKDCLSMPSYSFFAILLLQMGIVFVESLLLSLWIFSVKFETNLNIAKFECLFAAGIIFAGNLFLTMLQSISLSKQLVWFSSNSFFLLWLMSSIMLAFYTAYGTNFQLRFTEKRIDISELKKHFDLWIVLPAIDSVIKAVKILCIAWIITLILAMFVRPLHFSLSSLFAFWRFSDLFLLLFAQQLIFSCMPPIVSFFVMMPFEFTLPSVFYAATEDMNESTLINALEAKDPMIKLFALRQLHRLCSGTPAERKPFYTLSQPGGHPRNWHTLRNAALVLVHAIRDRLQFETHCRTLSSGGQSAAVKGNQSFSTTANNKSALNGSVINGSLLDASTGSNSGMLNELYQAKQSFFVPPSLNPRATDAFLSEQLQSRRLIGVPHFIDLFTSKIGQYLFVPKPILPSYDTSCTLYAVKALSSVISHSLVEDEYGVVQKDLKTSLSELTRLSIAIDAYVRASGRSTKSSIEQNICVLDEGLAEGLKAIRAVFGPHMNELDLHPAELEVFQVLI